MFIFRNMVCLALLVFHFTCFWVFKYDNLISLINNNTSGIMSIRNDKLCDVTCSWVAISDEDLYKAVFYRSDICDEDSSELSESGMAEIILKPRDSNGTIPSSQQEGCTFTITCKSSLGNVAIDAVDILCNARHMEVYSSAGGYLETSRGVRVDEALNCSHKLYMLQYAFEVPVMKCILKLASFEIPSELLFHSLHITTCQSSGSVLENLGSDEWSLSSIAGIKVDMNKVKSMMADVTIPDQANKLLNAIDARQKEKQSALPENIGQLLFTMMSQHAYNASNSQRASETMDSHCANDQQLSSRHPVSTNVPLDCRAASTASDGLVDCLSVHDNRPQEQPDNRDDASKLSNLHSSSVLGQNCNVFDSLLNQSSAQSGFIGNYIKHEIESMEKRLEAVFTNAIHEMEAKLLHQLDMIESSLQQRCRLTKTEIEQDNI